MVIKNEEMLRKSVPAAFATEPEAGRVSDRYTFLPTTDILEILQDEGWTAWKAFQVNSRTWSPDHGKHIIRLKHEDMDTQNFGVGDSFPEMLLINAHNGLGGYTLQGGIFRMVCSNGMVISQEDFGKIKLRHIGFEPKQVQEASRELIMNSSRIADKIGSWQNMEMTQRSQEDFFADATRLRWDNPSQDIIESVSTARRSEDAGSDLWSIFNVAQENIIRGGFVDSNTRRQTREITNISRNVQLNENLWKLASAYANN